MNILKTLGVLCAVFAFATVAGAAEVQEFAKGSTSEITILRSFPMTIDVDEECAPLFATGTGAACDDATLNEWAISKATRVTAIAITVLTAGDATSTCTVNIEVGATGANIGTPLVGSVQQAAGTTETQAQTLNLAVGDLVGLEVSAGTAACTGTVDPIVVVELFGYYLP